MLCAETDWNASPSNLKTTNSQFLPFIPVDTCCLSLIKFYNKQQGKTSKHYLEKSELTHYALVNKQLQWPLATLADKNNEYEDQHWIRMQFVLDVSTKRKGKLNIMKYFLQIKVDIHLRRNNNF